MNYYSVGSQVGFYAAYVTASNSPTTNAYNADGTTAAGRITTTFKGAPGPAASFEGLYRLFPDVAGLTSWQNVRDVASAPEDGIVGPNTQARIQMGMVLEGMVEDLMRQYAVIVNPDIDNDPGDFSVDPLPLELGYVTSQNIQTITTQTASAIQNTVVVGYLDVNPYLSGGQINQFWEAVSHPDLEYGAPVPVAYMVAQNSVDQSGLGAWILANLKSTAMTQISPALAAAGLSPTSNDATVMLNEQIFSIVMKTDFDWQGASAVALPSVTQAQAITAQLINSTTDALSAAAAQENAVEAAQENAVDPTVVYNSATGPGLAAGLGTDVNVTPTVASGENQGEIDAEEETIENTDASNIVIDAGGSNSAAGEALDADPAALQAAAATQTDQQIEQGYVQNSNPYVPPSPTPKKIPTAVLVAALGIVMLLFMSPGKKLK